MARHLQSLTLTIDADETTDGWEIVLRFDAESQVAAWSGIPDDDLPVIVGDTIAQALIIERDRMVARGGG